MLVGQPPGTVNGHIRITEQGEMLSFKYGLHKIALRNLELVVAGVAQSSLPCDKLLDTELPVQAPDRWSQVMDQLSASAYTRYRRLIYDDPDFPRFFEQATPILELGWLNIGSRPARRAIGHSIEELRAIPWVFAWMQSRYVLPSWYGVGGALAEYVSEEPGRLEELRQMYRGWPFMRAFLDNLQMTLSKADMAGIINASGWPGAQGATSAKPARAGLMQIHPELDEAAQVAGVSWGRNFLKIMLPLLKPGLLAAWFWVMVHAYRELTIALMLARSKNRTAAVVIFDLWEEGSFLLLGAFAVLMFIGLTVLSAAAHSISRRFGVQEQPT